MPPWADSFTVMLGRHEGREVTTSVSLGMYTVEADSCWSKALQFDQVRQFCESSIALMDTTGRCRASFFGARNAAWSPDGTRLAYMVVKTPRVKAGDAYTVYREINEGVGVFTPSTGELKVIPAPTDVLSWADNGSLALETRGWRYGLDVLSGHTGGMPTKADPTVMLGWPSPDLRYSHRPGTLRVWSLKDSLCVNCANDPTAEGLEKDLTNQIETLVGGHPVAVAKGSFWVQGKGHDHDLCVGVRWGGSSTTVPPTCEVFVIDVYRKVVLTRVPGTLIGPAMGGTMALVIRDGKPVFLSI